MNVLCQHILIDEPVPDGGARRSLSEAQGISRPCTASLKRGVSELMTPRTVTPARKDSAPECPDAIVTEMSKLRVHYRGEGEYANHAIEGVIKSLYALSEVHQAAALSVDDTTVNSKTLELFSHGPVGLKGRSKQFGISPSDIDPIEMVRQGSVVQGAEIYKLRTHVPQKV